LFNNPISNILEALLENNEGSPVTTRNAINILNRFRHLYYYLRFKIKFIQ
jgi:hypothetical protein